MYQSHASKTVIVNVDRCTVCVTTNELGDIDPLKVPIRRLPGDVLLEIFVFYVDGNERIEAWYTLSFRAAPKCRTLSRCQNLHLP